MWLINSLNRQINCESLNVETIQNYVLEQKSEKIPDYFCVTARSEERVIDVIMCHLNQ